MNHLYKTSNTQTILMYVPIFRKSLKKIVGFTFSKFRFKVELAKMSTFTLTKSSDIPNKNNILSKNKCYSSQYVQ